MSESLYRKYRPQVFGDVVGQDHIIKTLQNSISANKVSHAYLFCGPRGTGKTTTARILAKALLCENGPTVEPDGTCESCQEIAKSIHPDVSELDAASRTGVENVRDEIISRVGYAPVRGKYKVYVIDEVHMLSNAAFNALLKTLEEPPSHIVFVLCTTDPQKVPETIRSRCQRFDFRPINTEELTGRLGAVCEMEGVPFEGEALELIARRSNGGLRDALTALEQTIAFGDNQVSLGIAQDMFGKTDVNDLNELVSAIAQNDVSKCLEFVNAKVNDGVDFVQFVDDFAQRMRDVYVMKLSNCDVSVSAASADVAQIKQEATLFDEASLRYILSIIRDVTADLRTANNQRLVFELGVFKMLDAHSVLTFEAIDARLCALESGTQVSAKAPASSAKTPAPVKAGTVPPGASVQAGTVPPATSAPSDFQQRAVPVQTATAQTKAVAPAAPAPTQPSSQAMSVPPAAPNSAATVSSVAPAAKVDFRSIWKKTLDELRDSNPAIFSLLDSAHGSFNQPSKTITLKMEEGRTFAYNNLSKPASKTAIIEALEKSGLSGATVKVVMLEGGGEGPHTQEAPVPAPAAAQQGTVPPAAAPAFSGVSAPAGTVPPAVVVASAAPVPAPAVVSAPAPEPVAPSAPAPTPETVPEFASQAAGYETVSPVSEAFALKPENEDAAPATDSDTVKSQTQPAERSEIDEFNEILTSTFGEGTTFREVK